MNIKIFNWPPWLKFLILIAIGVLVISLIKGCKNNKQQSAEIQKLSSLNDSLIHMSKRANDAWSRSKNEYDDSLEFERGQRLLAEAQKERVENDFLKVNKENAALLEKYKYYKYADTSMVAAPKEFVDDCKGCFTQLEKTDRLSITYKMQVRDWGVKYERETGLLNNRISKIEKERDDYYTQVDSLIKAQAKSIDKIKPKGRLYLSWGVLWSPWPVGAGGGLMWQTPRNVIFGGKVYYGINKTTVETTMNFPLSLRKSK